MINLIKQLYQNDSINAVNDPLFDIYFPHFLAFSFFF